MNKKSAFRFLSVFVVFAFSLIFFAISVMGNGVAVHAEDKSDKIDFYAGCSSFSMYINDDGDLYSIGDNGAGQLGIANTISHFDPQFVMDKVSCVATGKDLFCFAVNNSGSLFAWGKNQHCELGLGGKYDDNSETNFLSSYKLVDVKFLTKKVVCGKSFALALDTDGKVYATGSNSYGQLGSNLSEGVEPFSKKSIVSKFTLIENEKLTNAVVVDIAACDLTSFLLLEDGTAYAFGSNYCGEFGAGCEVDDPNDGNLYKVALEEKITKISAYGNNAMALTESGKVYVWGSNLNGQLGRVIQEGEYPERNPKQGKIPFSKNAFSYKPILVNEFHIGQDVKSSDEIKAKDILCCGDCIFIISESGDLFSVGSNGSNHNCGIDGGDILESFTKVTFYKTRDLKELKQSGADEVLLSSEPVDKSKTVEVKVKEFIGGCTDRTFVKDESGQTWSFGQNNSTQVCSGNIASVTVPVKSTLYRIQSYDGNYEEKDYLTGPIIVLCVVAVLIIVFVVYSEVKKKVGAKNKTKQD